MTRNQRSRRHLRERGQSLVEFALVAPVLAILIFGIVDLARLYNAWTTIQGAAREGARYGVTGRIDCDIPSPNRLACIQFHAAQRAQPLTNSDTDLTVSVRSWDYPAYADPATENDPGEQCDALEVQVDYDFTPSTPLAGAIFGDVHLIGRERLVNEPFGTCDQ